VYGLGGGGTNIAYRLEGLAKTPDQPGFANLSVCYADTSRSNMRHDIPAEQVYLIDGVDGAGKIRAEHSNEINERAKDILQRFKPADLNILVATLAGGTGSVLLPVIARELASRGEPVIIVGIGDTSTTLDTKNTLNSIKSLENIAQKTDVPLAMFYLVNGPELSRDTIDKRVKSVVTMLTALYSGENRELDSRDLHNWIRFNHRNVTSFGAQLVTLHLVNSDEDVSDLGNIITVATLASEGQATAFATRPEYQAVGYLPAAMPDNVVKNAPHHFVTADGEIPHIVAELQDILNEAGERQAARLNRKSVITRADAIDDSGLVL
jgi:thioesterase domain-containing protein